MKKIILYFCQLLPILLIFLLLITGCAKKETPRPSAPVNETLTNSTSEDIIDDINIIEQELNNSDINSIETDIDQIDW